MKKLITKPSLTYIISKFMVLPVFICHAKTWHCFDVIAFNGLGWTFYWCRCLQLSKNHFTNTFPFLFQFGWRVTLRRKWRPRGHPDARAVWPLRHTWPAGRRQPAGRQVCDGPHTPHTTVRCLMTPFHCYKIRQFCSIMASMINKSNTILAGGLEHM